MGAASDYLNGGAAPAVPKRKGVTADYLAGAPAPGSPPAVTGGEISQGVAPWKHTVSHIARESLKGIGMTAGGILAGGAGVVEGLGTPASIALGAGQGILGAGIGYGIGNKVADMIDHSILGIGKPAPLGKQMVDSAKDVGTGMAYEMGGQAAGPVIGKGIGVLTNAVRGHAARAEVQAGGILSKAYKPTPEGAQNAAGHADLQRRMGIEAPMTRAQQLGTKEAGMFEQGLATSSDIAGPLSRQDTDTRQSSLDAVFKAMGPAKSAPVRVMEQPAGALAHQKIQAAYLPVKQAEMEAYAAIPKYEMPTHQLDGQISELQGKPMAEKAQTEFNSMVAYIKGGKMGHVDVPGVGKDTVSMREASKTLGNEIRRFQRAGDENTARPLRLLKAAIDGDMAALGESAANGSIKVHEGRIVYPEQVQAELDDVKRQMLFPEGGGILAKGDADRLTQRAADLENILAKAQPAENVSTAVKKAVALSRDKFARFKDGAVGTVRKPGDEINGLRMGDEEIRKHFSEPSGYDSLVKAVGPDEAKDLMRSHFSSEMRGTGEHFDVKSAEVYLTKHTEVLKKAGLYDEARGNIRGELPNAFKRELEAKRSESGAIDKPYFTLQETRGLMKKYGKTLNDAYGPRPVAALRNYHEVLTRQNWNKNQGYSGGSLTAEKIMNSPEWFLKDGEKVPHPLKRVAMTLMDVISGVAGGVAGHQAFGTLGTGVGGVAGIEASRILQRGAGKLREDAANRVLKLLREAVLDPAKAELLIKVMHTRNDQTAARIAGEGLAKMGATGAAMMTGRERETADDSQSPASTRSDTKRDEWR